MDRTAGSPKAPRTAPISLVYITNGQGHSRNSYRNSYEGTPPLNLDASMCTILRWERANQLDDLTLLLFRLNTRRRWRGERGKERRREGEKERKLVCVCVCVGVCVVSIDSSPNVMARSSPRFTKARGRRKVKITTHTCWFQPSVGLDV